MIYWRVTCLSFEKKEPADGILKDAFALEIVGLVSEVF